MASKKFQQVQRQSTDYVLKSARMSVGGTKKGLDHLLAYLEDPTSWGDRCFSWANPTERVTFEQDGKRIFRQVRSAAYLAKYPKEVLQGKKLIVTCKNKNCINPNHVQAKIRNSQEGVLNPAQKQRVKLKYSQGVSKSELAELFGCTVNYISRIISS